MGRDTMSEETLSARTPDRCWEDDAREAMLSLRERSSVSLGDPAVPPMVSLLEPAVVADRSTPAVEKRRPIAARTASAQPGDKAAVTWLRLGPFELGTGRRPSFGLTIVPTMKRGPSSTRNRRSCTIGPGFAKVGALENYEWFSDGSKLVMCLLMALGRLELFAIIVLLTPRFWRAD